MTFGAELEWSDVDSKKHIPENLGQWESNKTNENGAHFGAETWILNSDGSWADPLRRTPEGEFGGEINMRPTNSVDELIENFKQLREIFPEATTKSTSWGHITIGFGEPSLNVWNNIIEYVKNNERDLVSFTGSPAAEDSLNSDITLANGSHIASCWLTIYKEDKLIPFDEERWQNVKKRPMYYLPTTRAYHESVNEFLNPTAKISVYEKTKSEGISLLRYPTKGIIEFRCFGQAVNPKDFSETVKLCERIAKEMVKGSTGEPIKNFIKEYKFMKPWFDEEDFRNLLKIMNEFEESEDFKQTKKFKVFHSFDGVNL